MSDSTSNAGTHEAAMEELRRQQKILDYSTKEFTVELLVQKFTRRVPEEEPDIYIPDYQRNFRWGERRQSRFIESVLLGLPIPFLFFADMQDARYEVVDGTQRLSTCAAFLQGELELVGLDRLSVLDGFTIHDLDATQARRFRNRTIRSVVLSERATEDDRRDLFDRINTGSLVALPVEVRRGAHSGAISDLIGELAKDERFLRLCPMTETAKRKREAEELVTRLLAFSDGLEGYRDRVGAFLNQWLADTSQRAEKDTQLPDIYRARFHRVMAFVEEHLPFGFAKSEKARTTPRVRFDAIAIGAHKAHMARDGVLNNWKGGLDWLSSNEFFALTTSSSANSRVRLEARSDFVRDRILE